jgi:hypothetical protein
MTRCWRCGAPYNRKRCGVAPCCTYSENVGAAAFAVMLWLAPLRRTER